MADIFTPEDEVAVALTVMADYPIEVTEDSTLLVAVHAAAQTVADRAHARLTELGHYR